MKTELPFFWVDAFTEKAFSGNPCAVVLNADSLSDDQMLTLAREMNLSETAFVMKSQRADVRAKYFTPHGEIPLAGHPTISVMHVLQEQGLLAHQESYRLELTAGIVSINFSIQQNGRNLVTMTQLRPQFLNKYDVDEVAAIFGLAPGDFLLSSAIQTTSTGTPFLMLALKTKEALEKIQVDYPRYRDFHSRGDFSSPHFFCLEGMTSQGDTFAKHIAMNSNEGADPFTGSATGCMAAYLWKYQLIDKPQFYAEQGHDLGRPGLAFVEVEGTPEEIKAVKIAGTAITLIKGQLQWP